MGLLIRAALRSVIAFLHDITNDGSRTLWTMLTVWVVCSQAYALIEDKGPVEGLWWGLVTATTVGYGDYSPESTAGRFFGAVLMVSMWFLVIAATAHYTKTTLDDPDAWTHDEQEQLKRQVYENHIMLRAVLAGRGIDADDLLRDHYAQKDNA